jgi:16S rRNA (guanine527-N7)-methyltransferase
MPSLSHGVQQFNLTLNTAQQQAFDTYRRELIAWNEKVNLTRIVEPDEVDVKHFLDSLSIYPVLPELPADFSLVDVGTGAGFPGLPLKIALPNIHLTLLESTRKKTIFLQHVVDTLKLPNVTVVTTLAEEAGRQSAHREQYDVAVARAVAVLPVLAEYTLPLVKVGGTVIVQKGQNPADELKSAANALGILGGKIAQVLPVNVPGLDAERHLIVIRKRKPTPKQYPRRPGLPAQTPI